MGEFSAQWLGLREPVDHAARSERVKNAMLADLRKRHGESLTGLKILDLGCGSGSNLRAISPSLGAQQHWTLVDHDEALLATARTTLKGWADRVVSDQSDSLHLISQGVDLVVDFRVADLSVDLEDLLGLQSDLVSASALFDLVSSDWVDKVCETLQAPLYAVLSFDGDMQWDPAQEVDQLVTQAFCLHQTSDKGFGSALGPRAGQYLRNSLEQRGFIVTMDKSPWLIDNLPSDFHDMLIDGVGRAVAETGRLDQRAIQAWLLTRRSASRCVIGHDDLYAAMP